MKVGLGFLIIGSLLSLVLGIVVTIKIYDTQNTIIETDVTNYTMTSSNVISLSGASSQNQSGMLKVTVQ